MQNHFKILSILFFRSENIKYDVKYALRLCCERADMHREAVYLFCVLGHLEEAVTVALEQLTLGPSMSDYSKKNLDFISIFSRFYLNFISILSKFYQKIFLILS